MLTVKYGMVEGTYIELHFIEKSDGKNQRIALYISCRMPYFSVRWCIDEQFHTLQPMPESSCSGVPKGYENGIPFSNELVLFRRANQTTTQSHLQMGNGHNKQQKNESRKSTEGNILSNPKGSRCNHLIAINTCIVH